jgi:Protein kinase domain/Leucine rich repeat N-terminal domain/Leucine rich repeat
MEELSPLLFPLLIISLPLLGTSQFLNDDISALFTFRSALASRTHSLDNWTLASYPCTSWIGVYCSSTFTGPRIFELRLPGTGLSGVIPSSTISNLTSLRVLSLRYNLITSPLPDDLSVHRNITSMFLNNNEFTGPIPAVLSSLTSLEKLDLSSNNFSGEISSSLNNLTRLNYLYLQYNNFSGTLPQELNFPNLEQFNISYNSKLYGQIPPVLRKFPASAFIGTNLCGEPLRPCPSGPPPSPSAPSPAGPAPKTSGSSNKLSAGAIVGIVITSVVAVSVLIFLLVVLFKEGHNGNRTVQKKTPVTDQTAGYMVMHPEPAVKSDPPSVAPSHKPEASPYSTSAATSSAVQAVQVVPMAVPARRKLVFFRKGHVSKFDLEQLLRASAEVLGKGTFGTTYKAMLESGDMVAVKRLREVHLPEKEFREKVARVGDLEHKNIVPLLAYYYSKDEWLLAYDFMPMGSLSALLHGKSDYKIWEFLFLSCLH